jgi:hypothetical protein
MHIYTVSTEMASKGKFAHLLHFKFLVLYLVLCCAILNDYLFSFEVSLVQTFSFCM